jgi:hypothetical protein
MLTLVKTDLSPVAAQTPISRYTSGDAGAEVKAKIHPDARVFIDHGVFFVGIQTEYGRLILGHGETVKQAVDAAIAKNEG